MAISDNQKVDYLWKKLGYALTKTDTNTQKKAPNESIPSPLQMRGDRVMKDSGSIPGVIPGSSTSIVTVYPTSSPVECAADITSTANRSWKTNLTDWISPEFGSTYQVKVYIHDSSDAANATTGDQVFATGSNNDDEWFFDYQSGVLHFIGDNLPNGVDFTGKSVYISGARYTGEFGVGGDLGDFVFTNNEMAVGAGDPIIMDATTGLVIPVGTTVERSGTPTQGEIRFNSTSSEVEVYNGASWESIGSSGTAATFDTEQLSGDNSTVTFTLQQETTADAIIVVTGGIVQQPYTGYTVSGDEITFAEAPLSSDEVVIRYIASARVVTGLSSPDGTNQISVVNDEVSIVMNGSSVVTINDTTLDMNSNKIVNLSDPTNNQDAATKAYVDTQLSADLSLLLTVTDGTNSSNIGDNGSLTLQGTANEVTVVNSSGTFTFGLPDTINANVTGDVTGDLTGNADTASAWATARTLSLTGAVTGSASIDGSGNVSLATTATNDPTLTINGDASGTATFTNLSNATLTLTIADDSHNHTIANVDGLSTALASAESDAVTTANAYTDTRETAITTAYQTYADQAESDANGYTDTRETAITTAYQTYADQAESDAITSANSYTDTRETAITSAYESYADTAVSNLVASAPATLDTLNELAEALGDDPNFATTVATDIGTKVAKTSNQALSTAANALTISGNTITLARGDSTTDTVSITLGTNTNGNYVAEGATSGNGISGSVSSEGGTFTVTSNATSANTASTIVFRDANGDFAANTITGTATSAEYADLAERYRSDKAYPAGTVMSVGGDEEVTAATTATAHSVLGVISENPAYLMNKSLDGATIALKGRVPVRVEGQVNKGDRLAPSQTPGVATVDNTRTGWSFAIALESGTGIVEAVIL